MLIDIVFWVSLFFILYTCLGYLAVLHVLGFFNAKKVNKDYIYPKASVIIPAFNEEKNIKRRIDNILALDYPKDKMEIIIISDGSSDKTEEIARSYGEKLRLYSFSVRKGKAAAINYGLLEATGEIIVFADARQIFKTDAVKQLVANFNDPLVGAVSGRMFLTPANTGKIRIPFEMYWDLEELIRKKESRLDSVIGATGAIYAVRKSLYRPIPDDTILDDVLIPMNITLEGFRTILDDSAHVYDSQPIEPEKEFKRKVRTLTGNFQLIALQPKILSIKHNRLIFNYLSHKVFRLVMPYSIMLLFLSNLFMLHGLYTAVFSLQLMFYLLAFLGHLFKNSKMNNNLFSLPYAFILLNVAAVLGLVHFMKKDKNVWIR